MRVVATYSIKGGVGKTTAAVNLAYEAARSGARVLVWDLDPQGSATYLLRVRPKVKGGSRRLVSARGSLAPHIRGSEVAGVHVLPADFSLRHLDLHLDATKRGTQRLRSLLGPLREIYDVAILDCPPSISRASESVFAASDVLLVPVVPASLATRTLDQLVDFFEGRHSAPKVTALLSMVDRRRRLHRDLVESVSAAFSDVLKTTIPNASLIERMGVERAPIAMYAPRSAATTAFRDTWAELTQRLWS
jgi:cellulose biosynthesis protein BcsQ